MPGYLARIAIMIPVYDAKRQLKQYRREFNSAIEKVLASGNFILGPYVSRFEKEFAQYLNVKYAVGVASGTDALLLSLLSLDIKHGDEVIMPANSYPTAFAVAAAGARPKLVDIDSYFNLDADKLEKAVTSKTRAVIPVHMYGRTADMEKIISIAEKHKLPVIEDCAQAHGGQYRGKKVGTIGNIGCFSFYPTKNLGAFGDGGMVTTDNRELYRKIRRLRLYGEEERYKSMLLGRISRLDELQAAVLNVKLKYLDQWNERRRRIAEIYETSLKDCPCRLPRPGTLDHIYHLYVIRTAQRNRLKNYLAGKGIATAIHYPLPVHLVFSFKYLGYRKGDFPESEKAAAEILTLPMFPELKDQEVKQVALSIRNFFLKK